MKAQDESSPLVRRVDVHEAEAATALLKSQSSRYLLPYLAQESTASEAANMLGLPLNKVHRWTMRLLKLGLIVQTRTTKRSGRAVRSFRATASEFFVPLEALPLEVLVETDDTLHRQLQDALIRVFLMNTTHHAWGARVFLNAGRIAVDLNDGASVQERVAEIGTPAITRWVPLTLSREDAQALEQELHDLEKRYQARQIQSAEPYLLRLALAPLGATELDPVD